MIESMYLEPVDDNTDAEIFNEVVKLNFVVSCAACLTGHISWRLDKTSLIVESETNDDIEDMLYSETIDDNVDTISGVKDKIFDFLQEIINSDKINRMVDQGYFDLNEFHTISCNVQLTYVIFDIVRFVDSESGEWLGTTSADYDLDAVEVKFDKNGSSAVNITII